jgi:ribosomal protein S18 acetylase RimI-like enzyme
MRVPRELEIVLNGPIGPQRWADDTVVIDEGGWYRTLTPSCAWPASNEVLFSNLDERNSDGQIDALVSEYHGLGLPVTWCVYSWTRPGDLGARLLARGATRSAILAFLCGTGHPLEVVEGVDIEHIDPDSTEAYETYMKVMSSGYGLPASEKEFRRRRYHQLSTGPEPCMHLFIARHNGVVAGCQAMIIKEDSGHLTGANVIPAFRAHGIFQSLVAAGLRALREMKISIATGHSNEQSAFWVKRFGFKTIYSYDIYQLDPPTAGG